ncbi:MAG: hypothetical protein H0Z28_11655 [Archaeoglobus sp.]|nr:hypothetical protein [Archaeoglobus sp.]
MKRRLNKLEKTLKNKNNKHFPHGIALIDDEKDTMEIQSVGFKGSIEDGYRYLKEQGGNVVVLPQVKE